MPIIDANDAIRTFEGVQVDKEDGRRLLLETMRDVETKEVHCLHETICQAAAEAMVRLDLEDDPEIGEQYAIMVRHVQGESRKHPPRKKA